VLLTGIDRFVRGNQPTPTRALAASAGSAWLAHGAGRAGAEAWNRLARM
jgi:hypothetical protein